MSEDAQEAENLTGVQTLFERMGANPTQAEVMAKQLLKRADQIAIECEISKVEATERLLKKVIEARQDG